VKSSRQLKECERDFEIVDLKAFGVILEINNKVPFVSWINERKDEASLFKKEA